MGSSGGTSPSVLATTADLLTTGQEIFDRNAASIYAIPVLSGVLHLSYFKARKSESTTSTRILVGEQAAAATPTLCKLALFSIAANGDGTRVAVTANDTSLFAADWTQYSRDWVAPYSIVAGQWYARAVLVVTAGAVPHYVGCSPAWIPGEVAEEPGLARQLSAQADIPASFTAASLADTLYRIYGVIL